MSISEDYLRYVEEQMEAHDGGFKIDNDDKAEWAVRKIRQAQLAIEKRRQFVQAEIERLRAWQAQEDERDQSTIDRMTGLLAPYFDHLRESGVLGKRKSYKLPSGTLQVRSSGPKWRRVDEGALTEWAQRHGLVRTKVEAAWSEIGKRLHPADGQAGSAALFVTDDGELIEVPGVVLESPAGEAFGVKTEVQE